MVMHMTNEQCDALGDVFKAAGLPPKPLKDVKNEPAKTERKVGPG